MRRSIGCGTPRGLTPRHRRRAVDAPGAGSPPAPRRHGFAVLCRAVAAAALVLAPTLPAAAQQVFRFGPLTGTGEVVFSLQEQETLSFLGRDTLFDRGLSEERLSLRQTLTVVDSRFLTFDYGFTLGLVQSRLATEAAQDSGDGKLRSLDLTATLWPISRRLTFFFNRSDNETPVEFAGIRELATGNLGLGLGVGPSWFPGTVSLRESRLESSSDFDRLVRSVDRRRRALDYSGTNRWPRHELHASYRLEDVDDRVTPTFSHQSHNLNLNHRFEVLAPKLATLSSIFRYFSRGGDLSTSSLYLDELLRLRHRRYLESSFRYVAQTLESFSGPDSDSQRAVAAIHHRLWESLETDVFAARTRTTSPGSRTDRDEIGLDSAYKKKLPWQGQVTARLTSRYERRDNLRGDGQELVLDERHVARFGIPVRLDRPAVFPASVVVTDELRTTIYEEGIDYELAIFGDFAEISLLVGGAIRDGQTILVEYRVAAPAASRSEVVRSGFDLGLDYGWVAPYWGVRRADFQLVEGLPDRLLDDQEDEYAGVRFRVDRRRVQLVSFNEVRRRDSELQTFESLRLGQSLILRPAQRFTIHLNLARLDTDFTVPVRKSRVDEGRLSLRWTPLPFLSLETYASRRVLRDTEVDDQTFERLGFHGRWIVGKITIVAAIDRWRRGRGDAEPLLEESEGLTASLRVSRRFFPGRLGLPERRPQPEPWPADLPGLWSQPREDPPAGGVVEGAGEGAGEGAEPEPAAATAAGAEPAAGITPAARIQGAGTETAVADLAAVAGAAEPTLAAAAVEGEVAGAVEAWAAAWSGQRVDEYLSFYAEGFRPPATAAGAGDRAAWERLRRSCLTRPGSIRVEVSALRVEAVAPDRARARFHQVYRSDLFADAVDKVLELQLESGRWKILREGVAGLWPGRNLKTDSAAN